MSGPPSASEELERLCYDGESVVDAVTVSGGTVGVTTHRVLALTPAGEGPTLRTVERPNVDGVAVSAGGDRTHGIRSLRFGVYATVLLAASFLVNFDSVSAVEVPARTGAGAVVGMAAAMTGLLSIVDDVLRVVGVGVLVVALAFAALYGYSRDRYLAIEVDGAPDVRIDVVPGEHPASDRLAMAVEKASNPSDG